MFCWMCCFSERCCFLLGTLLLGGFGFSFGTWLLGGFAGFCLDFLFFWLWICWLLVLLVSACFGIGEVFWFGTMVFGFFSSGLELGFFIRTDIVLILLSGLI